MTIVPIKVAVFYDRVGQEYIDFKIMNDSQVSAIIVEYNMDEEYDLHFVEVKTDYEYSA